MYGHFLVPSRVPFRFCRFLVFGKLLLFINTIVHISLFLLFFWFFLFFPNLLVFSPSFFLMLKIFLFLLSPPYCIIMTQYVFQSFPSLVHHAKISRGLWMHIFVRVQSKSLFPIGFSNHPLLKTRSNK